MSYRYETHCHTSEVSICGRLTGEELVRFYHKLGHTGIIVTDHFFNGNSYVKTSKDPWEDRVAQFCLGYENAYAEGQKLGMDVFFAWEYSYIASDFLTYGLDREWLLAHPDVCSWKPNEYFDRVHEAGGFIVHAHPMRQAGYIPMFNLFPDKEDAIEVDNSAMDEIVNARAEWYADSYGLLKTAGSDTHNTNRKRFAGVEVEERFKSVHDYVTALKEGRAKRFSLDNPFEV